MDGLPHSSGDALADAFADRGVAVIEYALSPTTLLALDNAFPQLARSGVGAQAPTLSAQTRSWLAEHQGLTTLAGRLLGRPARPTRFEAFDMSWSGANWFVPWHQDRAGDGRERPVAQLAQIVALRIHLDACDEEDGPLEVIPRSHMSGRLDTAAIGRQVAATPPLLCLVARGDIVALRPLLIHRSQRARRQASRRIIALEYAPFPPASVS